MEPAVSTREITNSTEAASEGIREVDTPKQPGAATFEMALFLTTEGNEQIVVRGRLCFTVASLRYGPFLSWLVCSRCSPLDNQ